MHFFGDQVLWGQQVHNLEPAYEKKTSLKQRLVYLQTLLSNIIKLACTIDPNNVEEQVFGVLAVNLTKKDRFISPHFTVHRIGEGVFAALHKPGGGAIANAGFVDLGDRTLVFDTFISHLAAKDLRLAAELMTDNPVAYVINSHYHNDHMRGNQVFTDTEIITTQGTLELMHTAGQEELDWDTNQVPLRLEEYKAQYLAAQDEASRNRLIFWLDYFQVIIDSLPALKICYPQQTFEERLTLAGPMRQVELISYEGAHTGNDAILWLPEEKIAFLADLLFVQCHPFLPDGSPDAWLETLEKIKALGAKTLVPGHGPVGRRKDLDLMTKYIDAVSKLAGDKTSSGDQITPAHLGESFKDWDFSLFFTPNLEFMRQWLSGRQ